MDGSTPISFMPSCPAVPAGAPIACDRCPTRAASLCRLLDRRDLERLFPHGPRIQLCRAGTMLFRQGEPVQSVFILKSGWIATYKLFENGQRQIIRFALPGDLLGFEGSEAAGMTCSAEAITDVALCRIRHSLFFRVCTASPQLAMSYAGTLTREVLSAWNHLGAVGQQPALGRVANLLLDLHRRVTALEALPDSAPHGVHDGIRDGIMDDIAVPAVHLPISQIHIADATGLTSVHVCRTLKQMRAMDLLDFQKGRLVLLDPDRLAEIAQLDPDRPVGALPPPAPWAVA